MKFIPGEIVCLTEEGFMVPFDKGDCYSPGCEPVSWKSIAAMLAGNLRRAGYQVDGACVDADGGMWFWKYHRPQCDSECGAWAATVNSNDFVKDSLGNIFLSVVTIPPGTNWKDMIIEFPKGGE